MTVVAHETKQWMEVRQNRSQNIAKYRWLSKAYSHLPSGPWALCPLRRLHLPCTADPADVWQFQGCNTWRRRVSHAASTPWTGKV